ncbi:hypothetical protein ACQP1P_38685 [Dactylosporangium sp. CA-052675]|uniref:hypothetical protein n=1 Tax=Dactylosporangium sp. CA-052675 TaxID=3239927 RepID=UPI003D90FF54
MGDLHERLLTLLDQPWEIWAPVKAATVLGKQRLALRVLVERHTPVLTYSGSDELVCQGCRRDGVAPPWPCMDIRIIADQFGLTEGAPDRER